MHRCLYTEEASPWQRGFRFFPRASTKGDAGGGQHRCSEAHL